MSEIKKFVARKSGRLQELKDEKFTAVGSVTIGVDNKGRDKVIVNVGENTYSAFVNPVLTADKRQKLREYAKTLAATA